ncbi:hypothetical protein PVAND_017806 [Polypedilum vanderplanki]|uniref:EGF-like domain-containing protein n=1 Tax=Polypedilum vanderplanki TaxID=319348 RepID=A0A9J6B940_POLVA|nr:hypothetical protein PVAND_017806 [Polypedilum vanderplanki]
MKVKILIFLLLNKFTNAQDFRACQTNSDCWPTEICQYDECVDLCFACVDNTTCTIIDDQGICKCEKGFFGNPHLKCYKFDEISPCNPNLCGPNSKCFENNGDPYCECLEGFVNFPPTCRRSCQSNDDCETSEKCDYNSECINPCEEHSCGENAECNLSSDKEPFCKCKKNFFGDPQKLCHIFDKNHSCTNQNPCGPNSNCIENDEVLGSYCKCLSGFGNFPPNCLKICEESDECKENEFCSSNKFCEKLDELEICGENSVLRIDETKTKIYCSCKEGFYPEANVGCRKKTENDPEIPIELIAEKTEEICKNKCGKDAYCDEISKSCKCSQSYTGNPYNLCIPYDVDDPTDACIPNICGPYSICKALNETNAKCACIEGYGKGPGCTSCKSSADCDAHEICVDGKCIENVCENFCGLYANCNVYNGKFECSCKVKLNQQPYKRCGSGKKTRLSLKTAHALASW